MSTLRHRDTVLSLKYSTIEACFSVPMLNLTLPLFPFVVAFAVQALGWGTSAVGWMTALPHLCNSILPVLIAVFCRWMSAYQLLVVTFTFSALPWGLAGGLPWLNQTRDAAFAAILVVATLANCVGSVAWSSAISEVVPRKLSGRFFARRNLIFGAWTLSVVFVSGWAVGQAGNTITAFAFLFALAGLARLTGLFFLTRMRFPPSVHERQARAVSLAGIRTVLADRNYLRLVGFIGVWGMMINAAMPFYTVFLIHQLGLGVADVVKFTTLASLGGLTTLRGWGRLCDQFGSRPVLHVCALAWSLTALTMWLFAGKEWQWHLHVGYFIVGAVTAGFQLSQFNLMIKLAPGANRTTSVAVFLALTSLLTALGPVLGGYLLSTLPAVAGQILGHPLTRFHLLFVLAAVGCLAATSLAARVREPAEMPLETVWRAMQEMKAFNPMLSILSAGELLLTPRGLVALGQRSLRTARRQVRVLGAVGGEIVEGGREEVRKRIPRRG